MRTTRYDFTDSVVLVTGGGTGIGRATARAFLDAFVHLTRRTLPILAEHGGTVVAVSSTTGLRGEWNQAAYGAAKAAVSNLVRSLALDWGPSGVRLNAVAPSLTWSTRTELLKDHPDLHAKAVERIALGRLGEPEEVAQAVLFLASDAARFVTGVVLPVDGGTSAAAGQFRYDPTAA